MPINHDMLLKMKPRVGGRACYLDSGGQQQVQFHIYSSWDLASKSMSLQLDLNPLRLHILRLYRIQNDREILQLLYIQQLLATF